jgi:Flp pilus assembly protein TadG
MHTRLPPLRPLRPMRPRAACGVAAVEFALVIALLVLLLAGVSEFGRALYQYNALVKSAGAAARYLSHYSPGDAMALAAARNLVAYGSLSGTTTPLVPGLTPAQVTVCDASNCASTHRSQGAWRLNLVTVTVSGVRFTALISALVPSFTWGSVSATLPQGS